MKKAILVVSFGTTYEETRKICIESVENKIRDRFSDFEVRRAFTSQMVINKLKNRDGIVVDNVSEALNRLKREAFEQIYIQSLHIIPGHEFEKLIGQVHDFEEENKNIHISIGRPLLFDEGDYEKVVNALDILNLRENEAMVYMGHGTDHANDKCYDLLQQSFREKGFQRIYIGTVEGKKTIEDIIPILKEEKIDKVILKPFMLVAGDHANNDMAGDGKDSWKSILLKEGFQVATYIKGLGEIESIQELFVSNLKNMI
ncbi:sirohydrochlorin cobaltochelatase [Sporanaerobacter acetigenes]|uniref:Sirohydrochlorin cobaltochelatase n=1 Tax=Sporanaerobacter acetigenes DSM 13106 TaxID=1123281 RepID=A0A1M5YF07_9FIRM|nr:sirohydrochlorin cobaltochelatase [Sporanaerobacter acetigenes]SHI10494.1 sirohydrochlorin cobaltochelatase [Sporanaerobacter acetigenes DSM 13106]